MHFGVGVGAGGGLVFALRWFKNANVAQQSIKRSTAHETNRPHSYATSNTNKSDEIHTQPSRANSPSRLRTIRATRTRGTRSRGLVASGVGTDSTEDEDHSHIEFPFLKEQKRPKTLLSRGARSFEQPGQVKTRLRLPSRGPHFRRLGTPGLT